MGQCFVWQHKRCVEARFLFTQASLQTDALNTAGPYPKTQRSVTVPSSSSYGLNMH